MTSASLFCVRYDDEVTAHAKRRDEVATLKASVKQKECEIAELSSYMECLKAELDLLKPRADKYQHDAECYRQQCVIVIIIIVVIIIIIINTHNRFTTLCPGLPR